MESHRVEQYNIGGKPTVTLYTYHVGTPKHTVCCVCVFLKKNLNAPRPSEHPPVRGKNVKTFRWDQ